MKADDTLHALIQTALNMGASRACVLDPAKIVVEDRLAALCNGQARCPNFGASSLCPPHCEGPQAFRRWRDNSSHAVVAQVDIPAHVLLSEQRRDAMRLLQQMVAAVESRARAMGYAGSRAFGGGSCKEIFCPDHPNCRALAGGVCRHPESARPSMSGFGIDVADMMRTAGWAAQKVFSSQAGDETSMTWIAGLILIAR